MNRCINIGSQSAHNHVMAVNTNVPPPPLFFLPSTHSLPHDLWPIFCLYYDHRNTFKECDGLYIFFYAKRKEKGRWIFTHSFAVAIERVVRSQTICVQIKPLMVRFRYVIRRPLLFFTPSTTLEFLFFECLPLSNYWLWFVFSFSFFCLLIFFLASMCG